MNRDEQIAALLRDGATYAQIKQALQVAEKAISRVRTEQGIALPPERAKRHRAELDRVEQQAIDMLTSGATVAETRMLTRLSPNRLAVLRREHRIPLPPRDPGASQRRTVEEAFALYALPVDGGHLLWTGSRSGRGLDLIASGRRYNARHVAFRKYHGRDPVGFVCRSCDQPGCVAGAHHTDAVMRGTATAGSRS